jgi:hypothetical protein
MEPGVGRPPQRSGESGPWTSGGDCLDLQKSGPMRRRDTLWLLLVLTCCGFFYGAFDSHQSGPPIRSPWNLHVAYSPGYGRQLAWSADAPPLLLPVGRIGVLQ